jgi:hypothetical protein
MIGTIARIALMRVLPKRLIPVLTAWEVLRLIRGRQSRNTSDPSSPDGVGRRSRRR